MATPATDGACLEPLAGRDALARRLGLRSASDLTEQQLAYLDGASARFRGEAGHPITRHERVDELDPDGSELLTLPVAPVVEVLEFTLRTRGHERQLEPGEYQLSRRDGLVRRGRGLWPDELGAVTIRYVAGHEHPPADVAGEVLNLAEYLATTELGVNSKTVGGQTTSWTTAAFQAGVTEPWVACVERHRLNRGDTA